MKVVKRNRHLLEVAADTFTLDWTLFSSPTLPLLHNQNQNKG